MSQERIRLAIIGAGPIGLEAALRGVQAGYDVTVFESGRVADNVRDWGHVRLFSPFGLNCSSAGRAVINKTFPEYQLPSDNEILTGSEFVERYLLVLSQTPELKSIIRTGTKVAFLSRQTLGKGKQIAHPSRQSDPFRLLVETSDGEYVSRSDLVFDCSGTYGTHNWLGTGGIPCPGEISLPEDNFWLPDVAGQKREQFANGHTLVVGGGYSAATVMVALGELMEEFPETTVTWITRSERVPPLTPVENDTLSERAALVKQANSLVDHPNVRWTPGASVERIEPVETGWEVAVNLPAGSTQTIQVDRIQAQVGYRPDRSLYEELQVHECYASQGPMKLAAALLGETSTDCLVQQSHGADTLRNPEPGFFILGAKSYGRDSRFLIKIGLQQIDDVFSLLEQD